MLSQDAQQRTTNKWSFRKYDAISRNIISGELTNTDSRSTIQSGFNSHTIISEQFDATKPGTHYYTNTSFPFSVDSSKAIIVNYYDAYNTWRPETHEYYDFFSSETSPYLDAKGLLTGFLRRNTENNAMLLDAYYYDYKGRVKQIKKRSNRVDLNFEDFDLNFLGEIVSYFRSYYQYTPSLFNVDKSYNYDYAGRKNRFIHTVAYLNSPILVADYAYDNVGRLKQKKIKPLTNYQVPEIGVDYINRPPALQELYVQDIANKAIVIDTGFVADAHNPNTGTYTAQIDTTASSGQVDALQTIDYEYNIRGGINCINCKNHQVSLGNRQNDLFSMRLDYNEDTRYYDGNISRQIWKTPSVSKTQQYQYSYDASSRLTKAKYSGGTNGSNFSLDTVRYDKNGNILQLKRNTIDNLTYTYNGNQLLSVTDAATSAGFNDGNTSGNDYEYWPDGSLKRDKNKGIDSIVYHSFLRKVSRVKFTNGNWINFYYDGTGVLLKRKLSNGVRWGYIDEVVTKNDTLYQINQDEGRVIYDSPTDKWVYEYEYRDHLGNLRLSYRDSLGAPVGGLGMPPVVVQVNDYDPWGMVLDQISFVNNQNKVNNFDYSNRERQTEFGLNVMALGARMFDPNIGRFWSVDPKTEQQESLSPYHYSFNNPIRFNDPNGLMGEGCCDDGADGIGNGMTMVENLYWSTRDALVSSVTTVGTFFSSLFSDTKTQRVNASYENGKRTLSTEVVPKEEIPKEVGGSVLILATAVPSGGNAGTNLLLAKTGSKASTASSVIKTVKEQAQEIKKTIGNKNEVAVETGSKKLHYQLDGAEHKGVKTPHVQQSLPNIAPNGKKYFNKDRKWAEEMTQQDIRIIKKILKNRKSQ